MAIGGFAYCQASERRASELKQEALRRELDAERDRHVRETLDALAEQAERQRCENYVRAMGSVVLAPDLRDGQEIGMINLAATTVCANPESAIRQKLRLPK